jgi:hypothetical protein
MQTGSNASWSSDGSASLVGTKFLGSASIEPNLEIICGRNDYQHRRNSTTDSK